MSKIYAFVCFIFCSVFSHLASSQTEFIVRGVVQDEETGESIAFANVIEKGTQNGTTTDFEGEFSLKVSKLPVDLVIQYVGYPNQEVVGVSSGTRVIVKMKMADIGPVIIIEGERLSQKQKQAPLTVESMDLIAIKQAPAGSFYEGLGQLKGVDMTTASLGFRVINTRGFNSTSPVRTLQLIDGVDNQSPGLNFSLGNFLGAPDLDVKGVEIVQGASSAFFGPGAFNGVIAMETKNPFVFKGLSAQLRVGERSLVEPTVRWADSFKNKNGDEFLAYKINVFYLYANDWQADNYDPVYNTDYGKDNPGRYDAVNIYGDEYFNGNNFEGSPWNNKGIGTFFRTGYKESDVVDYSTQNFKTNAAVHYRLKPDQGFNSPELIYAVNYGTGTTVYQGDNRFRLDGIQFVQNRVELRKKDKYFIRVYSTNENAGKSYDPYFTALKLQEEARSDANWAKVYEKYWKSEINPRIDASGYPGLVQNPDFGQPGEPFYLPYDYDALAAWQTQYADSLVAWHQLVEQLTNDGTAGLINVGEKGFLAPGSEEFEEAFNRIIAQKNNEGEGGTLFYDRSALYHVHGEFQWEDRFFIDYKIGANGRLYRPNSDGTIFSDSISAISNSEMGAYFGMSRKFKEDMLIVSATIRGDKNQNFDAIFSPAMSIVYQPRKNQYVRVSFSSALRNPTLTDQYLYLNVGPAILSGNLNGVDSLIELGSFTDYMNTLQTNKLDYFSIDAIRPERVKTMEVGYRGSFHNDIFVDGSYYYSIYDDFIGYNIGIDAEFDPTTNLLNSAQVYRYSANSANQVRTQGLSVGVNYYFYKTHALNANYSWNKIVKADETDPIIPAFNTPEHKYNVGFSSKEAYTMENGNFFGYSVNYKWVKGFLFEGSPQFTGFVPDYNMVDAQVNFTLKKQNINFKLGASNLLNNKQFQTYGGPRIGRMAYFTILYELNK
jgi:iron complex outermembrane receptor protein